ncbi:hypothetical protein NMY22_g9516 [Coprinellus aureogranulatus]|nr:hypothetical protein NMY22_g9516 [Coprinellus aureogranulatus]
MLEATHNAPKNMDELQELLKDDIKVKVAGIDVDGTLRGKYMRKDKFLSSVATPEGFGFCSSIFAWDINDELYDPELSISNQTNGYRDLIAQVDLSTYRRLPWENNTPFFLIYFLDPETKQPLCVDPRSVLKKACERARKDGYEPYAGVELEFYNFKETPQSSKAKGFRSLKTLTEGNQSYSLLRTQPTNDYFLDLFDKSDEFQIPLEAYHTEAGPGVLEAALEFCSAERMGDNALLFKYLAKSIGMQHGVMPSFMAKIWPEVGIRFHHPRSAWAGASGHVHISLQDKDGRNIFAVSDEVAANGGRVSSTGYH